MCITFVGVNTSAGPDEHKLILISNRDEFYDRRSKSAHFWENAPHILGGMDMEPGREGGTWLAMDTKTGKIATLLNITTPDFSTDKRGRGSIIRDYLQFDGEGFDFCNLLHADATQYNPFNLVTINLLNPENTLTFYSSASPDRPTRLNSGGAYGFGNTLLTTPYSKVKDGQSKFEKIFQEFPRTDQQDKLTDELLQLLKSTEKHYPDPQLEIQASHFAQEFRKGLSSRFVHIPRGKYGTRTHTLIFVNGKNEVNYKEWTMEEPIINSNNPTWIHSNFSFRLNPASEANKL